MLNTYGAVWEASGIRAPLDVRLTNSLGQVLVIRDAIAVQGITGDIDTTAQFPASPLVFPGGAAASASEASEEGTNPAAAGTDAAGSGGARGAVMDSSSITLGVALPQTPEQQTVPAAATGHAGTGRNATNTNLPAPAARGNDGSNTARHHHHRLLLTRA
jgi:hypothetical protein